VLPPGAYQDCPYDRRIVSEGKLVINNSQKIVCDWRIPVPANIDEAESEKYINGQDVGCVGPSNPECPDSQAAVVI